ncbi:MAG TPA: hypothetical protein VJA66_04130 [Thermoanaerobaculia bacterium]
MNRKPGFSSRRLAVPAALVAAAIGWAGARSASAQTGVSKEDGIAAFETVKTVLQHPRCQNCHIPGDAPLQFDQGLPHAMSVVRGPDGNGAPGLACGTCHGDANPPAAWGAHMPPGAPTWSLPTARHRMVFIGLSSGDLCRSLKDKSNNGGRDFEALIRHVSEDELVGWGWHPGVGRAPVPIPREEFVAKFKEWIAAGAPCAP